MSKKGKSDKKKGKDDDAATSVKKQLVILEVKKDSLEKQISQSITQAWRRKKKIGQRHRSTSHARSSSKSKTN
jgi:hypothetical protein